MRISLIITIYIFYILCACNVDKNKLREGMLRTSALLNIEKENYDRAEKDLSKLITMKPNDINLYYLRGLSRMKINDYKNGTLDLLKYIDSKPRNDSAYSLLGFAYLVTEDFKQSLKFYNKAIEMNPNNAENYKIRSSIRFIFEEYEGSLSDLNKVEELNPKRMDASFYLTRGSANYRLGYEEKGCEDLYKAKELGNKNVEYLIEHYCK